MQISSTRRRRHVLILSADGFEDSELLLPYQQLNEEGVSADIASLRKDTIRGKHGMEIAANLSVDEVDPNDYDMLFLPGGRAPEELRKHERVLDISRQFFRDNKPVAAICHGPQILISAGVMKGKTATSSPAIAEEMRKAGVHYLDREVVVDGNLVTSRKPDDLPAFIREMLACLQSA